MRSLVLILIAAALAFEASLSFAQELPSQPSQPSQPFPPQSGELESNGDRLTSETHQKKGGSPPQSGELESNKDWQGTERKYEKGGSPPQSGELESNKDWQSTERKYEKGGSPSQSGELESNGDRLTSETHQKKGGSPSHYSSALAAFKAGNYREVIDSIDKELTEEPGSTRALLLKARALLGLGQPAEASEILLQAIELEPGLTEAELYLGDASFLQSQWSTAILHYSQYLDHASDPRDALLKIIYCKVAMRDLAQAGKLTAQLDPLDKKHPGYYWASAALSRAMGRPDAALQSISQVQTLYGVRSFNHYHREYSLLFSLLGKPHTPARQLPPLPDDRPSLSTSTSSSAQEVSDHVSDATDIVPPSRYRQLPPSKLPTPDQQPQPSSSGTPAIQSSPTVQDLNLRRGDETLQ